MGLPFLSEFPKSLDKTLHICLPPPCALAPRNPKVDFGPPGSAYMLSSIGRETTALLKVDLTTGDTLEVVAESEKCNVGGIMIDEETKKVQAVRWG